MTYQKLSTAMSIKGIAQQVKIKNKLFCGTPCMY